MENLFQYEIPYWHPIVVHFPFALLITAAVTMLIWSVRGTAFWRRCSLWLLTVGMVGVFLAYITGDEIEGATEGVPVVEEFIALHENMAQYSLILTGLTLLAMAGVTFWLERRTTLERNPKDPIPARVLLTLAGVIAAALVGLTAHIGGIMVWGVAP